MISHEKVEIAREKFHTASRELNFVFVSPYCVDDATQLFAFGYIHGFGSNKGAIIQLVDCDEKSVSFVNDDVITWAEKHEYFWSQLNIEPLLNSYNRGYFEELLDDWRMIQDEQRMT